MLNNNRHPAIGKKNRQTGKEGSKESESESESNGTEWKRRVEMSRSVFDELTKAIKSIDHVTDIIDSTSSGKTGRQIGRLAL